MKVFQKGNPKPREFGVKNLKKAQDLSDDKDFDLAAREFDTAVVAALEFLDGPENREVEEEPEDSPAP